MAKTYTKTQLRKEYLHRRNGLKETERIRASAMIRQRILRDAHWQEARSVLVYVSFGSEVDTHKLIQEALDEGRRVIVPIVQPNTQKLLLSELKHLGDLAPGHFQRVMEPSPGFRLLAEPPEVELVLAPGIVFDRRGGRIGFGGGYFDKLLPLMPEAWRMGLAFAEQIHTRPLPLEDYDVRMQVVVTDAEMIEVLK